MLYPSDTDSRFIWMAEEWVSPPKNVSSSTGFEICLTGDDVVEIAVARVN